MTDQTLTDQTQTDTPDAAPEASRDPQGTETDRRRPRRRGPIVLPVLLIGAGLIFLLQNLGVVDADIWGAVARLWPVALIAIGLDLLLGRRSSTARIGVAVGVLALLAALVGWGVATGSGEATTETIDQSAQGVESADIELQSGVGGLELAAVDQDALLAGTISVPAGHDLVVDREDDGSSADLLVRTDGGFPFGFGTRSDVPAWDLEMAAGIPTDLRVDTGVGESTLDLRRAAIESLDVDTGVGETTITLPERGDIVADVDGGVGEVLIRIPRSMAVSITADTGIGDVEVDGSWDRDGDRWVSDGYDTATDRVALSVDTGIGQVRIEQVP